MGYINTLITQENTLRENNDTNQTQHVILWNAGQNNVLC